MQASVWRTVADTCTSLCAQSPTHSHSSVFNLSNQMSHFYDKKLANNPFAGTYKFVLLLFSGTIESNLCVCFPSLSRTILIRYSFLPHSYEFPWKSSRAFFARFFFVGVIRSTSISFHKCNNMLVNVSRREWERERHCECCVCHGVRYEFHFWSTTCQQ